jgi:hypothetical protein
MHKTREVDTINKSTICLIFMFNLLILLLYIALDTNMVLKRIN